MHTLRQSAVAEPEESLANYLLDPNRIGFVGAVSARNPYTGALGTDPRLWATGQSPALEGAAARDLQRFLRLERSRSTSTAAPASAGVDDTDALPLADAPEAVTDADAPLAWTPAMLRQLGQLSLPALAVRDVTSVVVLVVVGCVLLVGCRCRRANIRCSVPALQERVDAYNAAAHASSHYVRAAVWAALETPAPAVIADVPSAAAQRLDQRKLGLLEAMYLGTGLRP